MRDIKRALLAVVVSAATVGCATRAPYVAPTPAAVVMPPLDPALFVPTVYDARWWNAFDDPVLEQLEAAALRANVDVRVAVARLDQARAIFADVERDRVPRPRLGASVDRREQVIPGFANEPVETTTYRAGVETTWELDVFGRVRSAIRAAGASAEAFGATLDEARIVVAAEVARQYFELRGLQRRLEVIERSLASHRETLRLTVVRRDAGIGEEQDVARARAQVAAVESNLPPIRIGLAARAHRLAVLIGARPGQLGVDLAPRAYPALTKALSLGDTSQLLRRRPDVRAAERRLAASAAREGVAAADLYPRISISGFLGLIAGRGSLFGTTDSRAWAVTPALTWAGFDLGSARARLRGAEAATRESLADYDRTVLGAIEETQNAFVAYRESQALVVSLSEQDRELTRAVAIARVRYREGFSDFLTLLDAERTQLNVQDAIARAEADVLTSAVTIYKVLGGVVE